MAGERVVWLVYPPGDAAICFKSETDERDAWKRLSNVFQISRSDAKATGWRCSQITVKEADGE